MKYPDFAREQTLVEQGFSVIGGVDEVGRGCWAGPVVVACVTWPISIITGELSGLLAKIRDSKTLSLKQRTELELFIKESATFAIGECSAAEVDQFGIGKATQLAGERAIQQLPIEYLLLDGRERVDLPIKQEAIIDGDALSISIASASIIAKQYRDRLMGELALEYPEFGFERHVGYGTAVHIARLKELGPTAIHRMSYKPVRAFTKR